MTDYPLLTSKEILAREQAVTVKAKDDPNRLRFHLMPPSGWLNDPNGLSEFDGYHHIFFQYNPVEPGTGKRNYWGHYRTRDFVHYDYLQPALYSENDFDTHGVYTGSILVTPEGPLAYYTGNVKEEGEHDYTHTGRQHNTILAEDFDGERFRKKTVLLTNADYPEDLTLHVRDPKVFQRGKDYYMVLGARRNDDTGEVLLYHSVNGRDWNLQDRLRYNQPFGYMWECPDLISLDDENFLIFSPQGIDAEGDRFNNVYQSGYAGVADFGGEDRLSEFRELDHGFDFYAPQTYTDDSGRTILIGWMGLPDTEPDYTYPTKKNGWVHALTIPRILSNKEGRIIQTPIQELEFLREKKESFQLNGAIHLDLPDTFEMIFQPTDQSREWLQIDFEGGFSLYYEDQTFSLDFTKDHKMREAGAGRTIRRVHLEELRSLRIFRDTSSVEIFINDGEEVFTSRFFPDGNLSLRSSDLKGELTLYELSGFVIQREDGSPLYAR